MTKSFKLSNPKKFIKAFLYLTIILFYTIIYMSYFTTIKKFLHEYLNSASSVVDNFDKQTELKFNIFSYHVKNVLKKEMENLISSEGIQKITSSDLNKSTYVIKDFIDQIILTDENSNIIASSVYSNKNKVNLSDRPYLKNSFNANDILVISDPVIGKLSHSHVIPITISLKNNLNVVGNLIFTIKIKNLASNFNIFHYQLNVKNIKFLNTQNQTGGNLQSLSSLKNTGFFRLINLIFDDHSFSVKYHINSLHKDVVFEFETNKLKNDILITSLIYLVILLTLSLIIVLLTKYHKIYILDNVDNLCDAYEKLLFKFHSITNNEYVPNIIKVDRDNICKIAEIGDALITKVEIFKRELDTKKSEVARLQSNNEAAMNIVTKNYQILSESIDELIEHIQLDKGMLATKMISSIQDIYSDNLALEETIDMVSKTIQKTISSYQKGKEATNLDSLRDIVKKSNYFLLNNNFLQDNEQFKTIKLYIELFESTIENLSIFLSQDNNQTNSIDIKIYIKNNDLIVLTTFEAKIGYKSDSGKTNSILLNKLRLLTLFNNGIVNYNISEDTEEVKITFIDAVIS
jgi:hypothetical protein